MKQARFHSKFHRVTVCINGVPYSAYAEVEVNIKKPAGLDKASEVAWNYMQKDKDQAITIELIPLAGGE